MNNQVHFILNGNKLFLEQILVELDVPLLYICADEIERKYVVLCIDSDIPEYIVTSSTYDNILKMLNNEIPMREIFQLNEEIWKVQTGKTLNKDISKVVKSCLLSDLELPEKGAYFELTNEEISQYKETLKKKNHKYDFSYVYNSSDIVYKDITISKKIDIMNHVFKNIKYDSSVMFDNTTDMFLLKNSKKLCFSPIHLQTKLMII